MQFYGRKKTATPKPMANIWAKVNRNDSLNATWRKNSNPTIIRCDEAGSLKTPSNNGTPKHDKLKMDSQYFVLFIQEIINGVNYLSSYII
jgi:hypothetical protein